LAEEAGSSCITRRRKPRHRISTGTTTLSRNESSTKSDEEMLGTGKVLVMVLQLEVAGVVLVGEEVEDLDVVVVPLVLGADVEEEVVSLAVSSEAWTISASKECRSSSGGIRTHVHRGEVVVDFVCR